MDVTPGAHYSMSNTVYETMDSLRFCFVADSFTRTPPTPASWMFVVDVGGMDTAMIHLRKELCRRMIDTLASIVWGESDSVNTSGWLYFIFYDDYRSYGTYVLNRQIVDTLDELFDKIGYGHDPVVPAESLTVSRPQKNTVFREALAFSGLWAENYLQHIFIITGGRKDDLAVYAWEDLIAEYDSVSTTTRTPLVHSIIICDSAGTGDSVEESDEGCVLDPFFRLSRKTDGLFIPVFTDAAASVPAYVCKQLLREDGEFGRPFCKVHNLENGTNASDFFYTRDSMPPYRSYGTVKKLPLVNGENSLVITCGFFPNTTIDTISLFLGPQEDVVTLLARQDRDIPMCRVLRRSGEMYLAFPDELHGKVSILRVFDLSGKVVGKKEYGRLPAAIALRETVSRGAAGSTLIVEIEVPGSGVWRVRVFPSSAAVHE